MLFRSLGRFHLASKESRQATEGKIHDERGWYRVPIYVPSAQRPFSRRRLQNGRQDRYTSFLCRHCRVVVLHTHNYKNDVAMPATRYGLCDVPGTYLPCATSSRVPSVPQRMLVVGMRGAAGKRYVGDRAGKGRVGQGKRSTLGIIHLGDPSRKVPHARLIRDEDSRPHRPHRQYGLGMLTDCLATFC